MSKVINTPIKIQGKKRNLIPFLKNNIEPYLENRVYVEPFLGSGVVAFNIKPKEAILSDVNYHIINLYLQIQKNIINSEIVRKHLEEHGKQLLNNGESYYYEIRDEFNQIIDLNNDDYFKMTDDDKKKLALFFIFLNSSCFNGVIRFNRNGKYNVPFCKKPNKFTKAYITKICNTIKNVEDILQNEGKNWIFKVSSYENILDEIGTNNPHDYLVYLDPPYLGTNNNYYQNNWELDSEVKLYNYVNNLLSKNNEKYKTFLSNWYKKTYEKDEKYDSNIIINQNIQDMWLTNKKFNFVIFDHQYIVASKNSSRMKVEEILIKNI